MLRFLRWLVLALLPLAGRAQQPSDFRLEKKLGTPLFAPVSLEIDAQQHLHVLDGSLITTLTAEGTFVRQTFIGNPAKANSVGNELSMDAVGNYYVVDFNNSEVRKVRPDGQLLLAFGGAGSQPGQFWQPNHLRVDAAGDIYVTEQATSRLQKFDARGRFLWAYEPAQPSSVMGSRALDLDQAGNAYVLDSDFGVVKISPAGQLVRRVQLAAGPGPGVFFGSLSLRLNGAGHFYVGVPELNTIRRYDAAGQLLPAGSLSGLHPSTHLALAFDAAGSLYATGLDWQSWQGSKSKLYKFDLNGQTRREWGNLASFTHLAQDAAGNFCVFDALQQTIIKYDPTGRELLRFGPRIFSGDSARFQTYVAGLAFDLPGNIYIFEFSNSGSHIGKYSPQGRPLGAIRNPALTRMPAYYLGMALDPAGNIYLTDVAGSVVRKFNQQGQQLLQFGSPGRGPGQFEDPKALAIDARGYVYVADINGHRVQKFSPLGQLLRENKALTMSDALPIPCQVGLSVDAAGTVYMGSSFDEFVQVYDPSGRFGRQLPGTVSRLAINRPGDRLLTIHTQPRSNPNGPRHYSDVVNFFTALTPRAAREAVLTGHIYHDQNYDCQFQPAEPALAGIVVVAEPGDYYGLTDENGRYTISADTGTYTVRQLLPTDEPGRLMTPTCERPGETFRLAAYGTTAAGPDFGNRVTLAPHLRISVASNRRRRCFRNQTSISYANTGFAVAPAAKVFVKLPEHVVLISAAAPYTRDQHGNYVFAVGDLAPQQQGSISIIDSVACGNPAIRGLTVCTNAWITPGNPVADPQLWNQGSVAVRAQPGSDGQVRFALVNKGRQATGDSLGLRLFANARLLRQGKYALAAGDSLVLRVPAPAGQALRLEADQPTHHPLAARASATTENGPSPSGQPNPARHMLAADVTPATQAEDCQPIIDSFDPNDKQVLPTGTGPEHYTPTGTALHYRVRFQNTGTDVAYRVEIVDTLSADLDLRSLRVGAASHSYRLQVSGKARPVLTFTFDGIMLPEQRRDEAGSNGFVTFTICPKVNLPAKTKIENLADIFFDYNEPVRTNATVNRIYDVPPTADPAGQLPLAGLIVSPELREVTPAQGRAGTVVTLRGRHFGAAGSPGLVSFKGLPASVLSAAPGTLTVRVPAGAVSGRIRLLTTDGGTSSSTDFVVFQPPTLSAAAVTETIPGAELQLSGTHFSSLAEQDTVSFSGVPALVLAASATQLTVRVPAGTPHLSTVRLATLGGVALLATPVRVWQRPELSALSAGKGKAGDLLTLTGRHFADAAGRNEVRFGPAIAEVVQATATTLRVRVPAGSASGAVQVRTPGGEAWSAQAFAFVPAPLLLAFRPAGGPVGSVVTLSGQHFNLEGQADSVYFAGGAAKIVSGNATELRVRVPRGARSGTLLVAGAGGRTTTTTAFQVEELAPDEALRLYPNPAPAGSVMLDWRQSAWPVTRVRVFDVRGALQLDIRPEPAADTLPLVLAGQRTGLYLVLIETAQGQVRKRLTVE